MKTHFLIVKYMLTYLPKRIKPGVWIQHPRGSQADSRDYREEEYFAAHCDGPSTVTTTMMHLRRNLNTFLFCNYFNKIKNVLSLYTFIYVNNVFVSIFIVFQTNTVLTVDVLVLLVNDIMYVHFIPIRFLGNL
uniref:Uncharacterized protein n=1 Tax=Dicentrarchus labrax TaxID=13489 RepID=E6ZGK3_DICLA|nr:Uncharacterized protein [Dicentrarchus labrax]